MTDQPSNWDDIRREGRRTLIRAIAAGLISGVVAAALALWGYVSQLSGPIGLVPSGAVVAFDMENGCPSGWTDIGKEDPVRFAGRTLVAVGPAVGDRRQPGEGTRARVYGAEGGQEAVVLEERQMPVHHHPMRIYRQSAGGEDTLEPRQFSAETPRDDRGGILGEGVGPAGKGEAHNNMPPYIALYFCRKN